MVDLGIRKRLLRVTKLSEMAEMTPYYVRKGARELGIKVTGINSATRYHVNEELLDKLRDKYHRKRAESGIEIKGELEEIVKELAATLKSPDVDSKKAERYASILDERLIYGERQKGKDLFMKELGLQIKEGTVQSEFMTITQSILYLFGLGVKDLGKVAKRKVSVIPGSVEEKEKRVNYLIEEGVKTENLGEMIESCPQIIEYSIDNILIPHIELFKSKGITNKSLIGEIISRFPQIMGRDIDKLNVVFEFMSEMRIRKKTDLVICLLERPQVFALDYETNIKPAYDFLAERGGANDPVDCFKSLSFSLEKRIKPRYYFLEITRLGVKFKAGSVLKSNDREFAEVRAKSTMRRYEDFKIRLAFLQSRDMEERYRHDFMLSQRSKFLYHVAQCIPWEYNDFKKEYAAPAKK